MYLKKLIGAFTALIMTVTVFAGFTVTANAASVGFNLTFTCDNQEIHVINNGTQVDYNKYSVPGSVLEVSSDGAAKKYVVNTFITNFAEMITDSTGNITIPCAVTVSEAVTLDIPDGINGATINVTSSTVGSYMNGDYVTAKGATVSIIIMPPSGQQIKSVTIGGKEQEIDVPTSWDDTYTMNEDAILSVTFAGTHSISVSSSVNGTVNVPQTTAKEGDTITVYPMPSEGYRISNLTYTSGNETKNINLNEETQSYTFEMPDAAVTINATFEKIPVYPSTEATHKGDYNDPNKGDSASLWEGTLVGQGTAYCPKVTVTLNGGKSQEAIGQTTVAGDSSVTIAVVVDKVKNDIKSVMLEGVGNPDSSGFEIKTDDPTNSETGEVD